MHPADDAKRPQVTAHTRGSVFGWVIPHLVTYLTRNGFDASPLLQIPGIRGRDFGDPDVHVPESAVREAWHLATTITGDEALGIHVAEFLPRGAFDLIEYAFRSSSTLAIGVERLARDGRLINDRFGGRPLDAGPGFRIFMGLRPDQPSVPQRSEFGIALIVRLSRDATGTELVPLEVCFAHDAPRDLLEHRRFFRSPLQYGGRVYALAFRDSDGQLPLLSADEALATIVRRRLDKALATRDQSVGASAASRVRRLLVERMGQDALSIVSVGRELGLSARTLSRRLVEEGTSFRAIRDEVRSEIAAALLGDPATSVADIAFFLGYSEPAPFHRSFKRWTGLTPRGYRRDRPS